MKQLIKLLLVCILLNLGVYAQKVKDTEQQIDTLFSKYNSQTPGVAVGIVKDGKLIFKKGYGTANLEYDIPITSKTLFNIGSVSKQFTAFSLYLLEKQGKLSLEDDVRKYIPEVPDFGKAIKIKHLLGHTSGLRDQWALLTLAGWLMDDIITTEHILKLISKQKELNFEPGNQYAYCNAGYGLAAVIVSRTSGKPFAEFVKESVFKPLGMNDSHIYNDAEKIVKNRADSYEIDNGVYEKRILNQYNAGPSNLITTVEDLSKWTLNFEKPIVGDAEMIEKFNQPTLLNDGRRAVSFDDSDGIGYYAKGQNVWTYRGANVLSHGGHTAAFNSAFWRFPEKRFAIIFLSNDQHFDALKKVESIADIFLKNDLKPKKEVVNSPVAKKEAPKFENNLKDFEGEYYSDELSTTYFAKVKNGKLVFSHNRLPDSVLTETEKDKFYGFISFRVEVEFIRNNNLVIGFKVSNWGAKNVKFMKLK